MATIGTLGTLEEWQTLWEAQKAAGAGALLIFKRSPVCPTSHFVEGVFQRYIEKLPEATALKIFSVDVIGARPVSQKIAADTGVRHESPQALLIRAGQKVAWHASHGAVDEEALEEQLGVKK